MKAEEFDEKFDRDEDITSALDVTKARRPGDPRRLSPRDRGPAPT